MRDDEREQDQQDDRTDRGLSILPALRSTNRPRPDAHACVDGWTGTEDAPTPCPVCRPHLRHGRHGWYRPERSTDRKKR